MQIILQKIVQIFADIFATAIIIVKALFYTANILKKYFCKKILPKI